MHLIDPSNVLKRFQEQVKIIEVQIQVSPTEVKSSNRPQIPEMTGSVGDGEFMWGPIAVVRQQVHL